MIRMSREGHRDTVDGISSSSSGLMFDDMRQPRWDLALVYIRPRSRWRQNSGSSSRKLRTRRRTVVAVETVAQVDGPRLLVPVRIVMRRSGSNTLRLVDSSDGMHSTRVPHARSSQPPGKRPSR